MTELCRKFGLDVDSAISQLLDYKNNPATQVQLPEGTIRLLCQVSREVFMQEGMLLELNAPVNIFGDIHGQYDDLLRHFDKLGYPPDCSFLFMGDYVDRGKKSLETICLLLAYKIKYPNNMFLLRGNHESASINRIYGFYDECKRRYNIKLWKTFTDCFNCLPIDSDLMVIQNFLDRCKHKPCSNHEQAAVVESTIFCCHGGLSPDLQDFLDRCKHKPCSNHEQAAVVESTIFCCHGGLSPDLQDFDQLRGMQRPMDVPDKGLVCDLLWSDPDEDITGWGDNDRGVSWTFGGDVVRSFLKKHDLSLIARAHQVVEDGYRFFEKRKLVTLFSAPNYCGEFDNAGGVLVVSKNLMCSLSILKPKSVTVTIKGTPTQKKSGLFSRSSNQIQVK